MNFFKEKIKWIIIVIAIVIITSGISVYATATYLSSQIEYTKVNGTKTNVASALDELYGRLPQNNAYVLGSIGTINIGGTNWESSSSYSSNEEFMTTTYSNNHIYINILKDMNLKFLLCKTSRGSVEANAIISINNTIVSTTALTSKIDNYTTIVHTGDTIDIYIGYGDNTKSLGILVYNSHE